jgi:GntR family transcriptional regulator, carbon starvation induced regulator
MIYDFIDKMKRDALSTAPFLEEEPKGAATLEAIVRERVRGDILSGVLEPNSRLRIRSLSLRYGVGGSPLREALSRLVPEGLIRLEHNRGFRVTPLSIEELKEITEMRQILEVEAFRRSGEHGGDDWEGRIIASFHQLAKCIAQPLPDPLGQRLRWEERHRAFHRALVDACGNSKLLHAIDQLYQNLARYRVVLQINDLPSRKLTKIHETLVDHAIGRNLVEGSEALRRHFDVNIEQVHDTLRQTPRLFDALADA